MFRICQSRQLYTCRSRISGRKCKQSTHHQRQNHNDVIKAPLNRYRSAFKTGLLAGAIVAGGVFVKLQNSVFARDDDGNGEEKSSECYTPDGTISLTQAVEQCRDIIQRKKDEVGTPGITIAVSVDGRTVWTEGFGYSDVENRLKCTPDTIFRIASISKSITMTAVAKLLENGDLDLDKPVQFYVPEFPEKTWNGEKVTITTRQLLSHLGGIRHYSKDYIKQQESNDKESKEKKPQPNTKRGKEKQSSESQAQPKINEVKDELQLEEYYIQKNYTSVLESLALFKDDPLVHKPESKFLYTTHGWTLVSVVLEKVSKMPFDKLLLGMLDELGMENTYLDEHKPLIYNRGRHYVKNKKGRLENAPYVDLSYKWAGGGLLSNVFDLIKFGNVMLYSYQAKGLKTATTNSNLKGDNKKISGGKESLHKPGYLKSETVETMWTPVATPDKKWEGISGGRYGLGWSVWSAQKEYELCKDRPYFVSHTGGAMGASSVLLILPAENALTNTRSTDSRTVTTNTTETVTTNLPNGVVVAIITNMMSVGLNKTAYDVARVFERVEYSGK